MYFIQLSDITYTYPNQAEPVLRNVSFTIGDNERIAIIGENGKGKSTLIRIIIGQLADFQGNLLFPQDKPVIGFLPQEAAFTSKLTVFDELLSSMPSYYQILRSLKTLIGQQNLSAEQGTELAELWNEYYRLNLDNYRSKAYKILSDFSLYRQKYQQSNTMSEGEKTKLQLGKLLLKEPHILVLDEPTNHLDIESLEWLENWINGFNGTVVYVSHDRMFIDNTATKIVEINQGIVEVQSGNYSTYKANNKDLIGIVLGCDILPSLSSWYLFSFELRLINETALSLSGTMKF